MRADQPAVAYLSDMARRAAGAGSRSRRWPTGVAEDNPGSERVLVQAAGRAGFEPRIELEAGDLLGKVALVAAGLAVALVPGLVVPALPAGVVVRRLVDAPTRGVYAVRRAGRVRPGVDALVDALTAAATSAG